MHNVLYALSAVVVIAAVVVSLVSVRRAHEGVDLELELTAIGRLDDLVAHAAHTSHSTLRDAA